LSKVSNLAMSGNYKQKVAAVNRSLERSKTNLKILQITDSLRSGGKERQLVELLTYLSTKKDVMCELITMSENVHYTYVEDLNIKTYQIIRKQRKDLSVFFKFYKLFKEARPDVIHSWNSMCSVYAIPAAKLLGIKFVNGFLRDAPPKFNIKRKEWLRAGLTFPLSDKILSNSCAGLNAYKVPARKGVCVHNGFNFERTNNLEDKNSIKEKYSIKTQFIVGMVATFSDKKDYVTFINAAQTVLESRDDVTFIAVGDGDNLDSCKNQVKPEFKNRIKFFGRQKDVESIINVFDIGVLATNDKIHGEGISNTIMEYMALEKPVIATDCGGNRELVKDGETGILVKTTNSIEMAQKILLLLENEEMTKNFGRNGREKLKSEFNLEKMGNEFENLYRELLGK